MPRRRPQNAVNCGENGNADDHTDQAEEIPADDNREENPESRDANRIAENHRADEIAIQLLDNQNQNQENQRLPRIEEEQNHRAGYRADERAEHGDDVRDADNDADERRVRQAEDVHADKRQYTNNRRIKDFSGKKAAEIAVCVVANPQGRLRGALRQERARQHPRVAEQLILL